MSKGKVLYMCNKRKFGVEFINYCDWFEKRRSNLTKRCCKNCRYVTNEESKQNTSTNNSRKDQKSTEDKESAKTKKPKK